MKFPRKSVGAASALMPLFCASITLAQVANLRITEVNAFGDVAEVTNTGPAFNDVATSRPFCHKFIYTSVIPASTTWTAGQVRTFNITGLDSNDSDLWLYINNSGFALAANMIHGVKFGPAASIGRTSVAVTAGLWPSTTAFCPRPPSGQTISWDRFGNSPRDWYLDETPSMGSSDPATSPTVNSLLASPGGMDDFETLLLGDTVEGMIGYFVVNTSTTSGIFTVRTVSDVLGVVGVRPGSTSTQWMRIRDQDAADVQNRFYTVPVSSGGDFNYSWTFFVNIEETPPSGAAAKPRFTIQHEDGTFQNAWGIEFANTGASLVVTGIGGAAATAPLYPLSSPTGLGQWVEIDLNVDFSTNQVSAAFNNGAPVSLPINLSPTANKGEFRFCYRGEGIGNINTMLLDDVSVNVTIPTTPLPPPVTPSDLLVRLDPILTGLPSPVSVVEPNDGSGRLFIVDQTGQIRILDSTGTLLPTPFLDLSAVIPPPNAFFDERGVLGLAFHPNFGTNGRFFVRYSLPRAGLPTEPCNDPGGFIVGCHEELLSEFNLSSPNVANQASEIVHFRVNKPEFNHNSGGIAFGPDGYLYFTLGDGGGANDGLDQPSLPHGPTGNGQNINAALGKVIRLDVDSPPEPGLTYAIPPTNPFVGVAGLDEIFAYGFRNPFKFCFDNGPGGSNALIVADVGQDRFEEVNFVVNGGNYGWVIREGNQCFDPLAPSTPPAACASTGAMGEPLLEPVASYDHANGDGISIIGGFVYRGTLFPALVGKYIFGDFSTDFGTPNAQLYYMDADGLPNTIFEFRNGPANGPYDVFLKGFGEDIDREIYVLGSTALGPTGTAGIVFHLVPAKGDMNGDGAISVADVPLFADVLVESNTLEHMVDRADIDDDAVLNGLDLTQFVDLLLP